MRIGVLEEAGYQFQVVRDNRYYREMCGFIRTGDSAAVETAYEMEKDLLLSKGYPQGSYSAPGILPGVASREWEDVLWTLESEKNGSARKALEWIEEQRVYEKAGMAIVYVVVKNTKITTIYLGALTQPSRPTRDILWKFLWVDPGE